MTDLSADALANQLHPVQQPGRLVSVVHRPRTVPAALRLLAEDLTRRPIAGGTDILLELHRGGAGPSVELIDLSGITGFDEIEETDSALHLSGGVRHGQVVADSRFVAQATPLAQACLEIGSPQLRNRATIAGNLVTASPANDSLSALLALGAVVELSRWDAGAVAVRRVPVADFFTGFRSTALTPGELITTIEIPKLSDTQRGLWVKLGNRRAQAISVIHAGFVLDLRDGVVMAGRAAFGSVAATVQLAPEVTEALIGSPLDDEMIDRAAAAAVSLYEPLDDVRATAEYRRSVLGSLVKRSLRAIRDDQTRSQWPEVRPGLGFAVAAPWVAERIDDQTSISAVVNGSKLSGAGAASRNLMDWIRGSGAASGAGLDGTKEGCGEGECGACTVTLNGAAVMSCIVQAAQADGGTIVTVEGLAGEDQLHPLQQTFINEFAVQCGYCIPGFLVAGGSLLDEVANPTEEQIKLGLSGNLCRCTGYYPIIEAVKEAAVALGANR